MRKLMLVVVSTLVFGLPFEAPAQGRQPVKSIATFSARMNGGVIRSPHLHIVVSVTGRYGFYRSYHGHVHEFYGFRISAQHCKRAGCWGEILHANLPVRYPRGTAVASRTGLPTKIPCWTHACVNPVEWAKKAASAAGGFSNWIGESDEWFFKNITLPCVAGTASGWANTAREQLSRRLVFIGGYMSKAKLAAGVAGPEGYAVAGVGGCGLTLSAYGLIKTLAVARKLGVQV